MVTTGSRLDYVNGPYFGPWVECHLISPLEGQKKTHYFGTLRSPQLMLLCHVVGYISQIDYKLLNYLIITRKLKSAIIMRCRWFYIDVLVVRCYKYHQMVDYSLIF